MTKCINFVSKSSLNFSAIFVKDLTVLTHDKIWKECLDQGVMIVLC